VVLLDTHIWLWWLLGEANLSGRERNALEYLSAKNRIAISWVTIWETEMLERKDRITLQPDLRSWMHQAARPDVSVILPVDVDVVLAQRKLPESFHNDPADRLITATAMLSGYPLATHDKRIREAEACKIWVS
jgi:PIN domain nuclease of toxin-antitoxin system